MEAKQAGMIRWGGEMRIDGGEKGGGHREDRDGEEGRGRRGRGRLTGCEEARESWLTSSMPIMLVDIVRGKSAERASSLEGLYKHVRGKRRECRAGRTFTCLTPYLPSLHPPSLCESL